jgi:hypothetical protein
VPTSLATCAVPSNTTYSIAPPPVVEVTTKADTTGRVSTESRAAIEAVDGDPSVFSPSGDSSQGILSGETVTVNGSGSGFTLAASKSTTIKFRATINTGIAAGTCAVSTQGSVAGTNFTTVLTDDPSVGGGSNPTSTTIVVAPTITTCQSNITATIAASACTSSQSFAAVATGCPTPTLTYKIGATTITSPYAFPVGTTTVDVTASNGIGTNATCSFTVTVTRDAVSPTTTNNALAFNGSNSVAISNCSGAALDVLNAITIEYWFKGSSNQSAVRLQPTGSDYIVAGWNGKHIISTDGGTTGIDLGATATNGGWHHVAMTWQRNTVNGFKSYLDGQLVAQRTSANVALPTIASGMFLGAFNGSSEFMTGSLDEVRVWNVARTQTEIQTNMMGCTSISATPNLVMYYQFNHGAADGTNSSINTMVNSANATTFPAALNGFTLTGSSSNWTSSPLCTNIFTWTGAISTDWANLSNWSPAVVPSSTSSVIIPATSNVPTLSASQTINNLGFSGANKVTLGNNTLTVNSITGSSNTAYVVTNGTTGGLVIKNVSTVATAFPVGPSSTVYAPAIVTNNVARDFTVKVGTTVTNAAALTKAVNLQWDITPSVLTGNSATLGLGWPASSQGSAFSPSAPVFVGHYNTTLSAWDRFRLATVTGNDPYVATVSGVDAFSPFAIGGLNALSVELLDFKGTPQYNGNFLTWTTANEVNNKGFQVERASPQPSQGASMTWETLGFVNAKGKAATYEFTDKSPPRGLETYRLRQIDNDGKETLSKVISIERKAKTGALSVYPNPAHNHLTIDYAVDVQKNTPQYTVVNLLGQILLQGALTSPNLDISTLPSGAFILKIGDGQAKFFKQ